MFLRKRADHHSVWELDMPVAFVSKLYFAKAEMWLSGWTLAWNAWLSLPFKELTFVQHLRASGSTKETLAKQSLEAGFEKSKRHQFSWQLAPEPLPRMSRSGCGRPPTHLGTGKPGAPTLADSAWSLPLSAGIAALCWWVDEETLSTGIFTGNVKLKWGLVFLFYFIIIVCCMWWGCGYMEDSFCESVFLPLWIWGIKLRSSGLWGRMLFICWDILPSCFFFFLLLLDYGF